MANETISAQANASSAGAISLTLPAAYARVATQASRITTLATSARLITHIHTGATRVN